MSDVLFVVPVFECNIKFECYGTLLLATILKENGVDVDIYRYYESKPETGFTEFVENSARNILARMPKIVSFYCRGDCYLANIRVAERIKELDPDVYIVFGGPQADIAAYETIKQIPWVDYCCSGEGETTIYPLFSGLLGGKDVSGIRGLTYRNEAGQIVTNPRPELIENLDELPFTDFSFVPEEMRKQAKEKNLGISIDVGRGCPYNCAYCSTSKFWQRKFRLKSPRRIVDEMKHVEKVFGIRKCIFDHDLFTVNKSKVYELCRLLKEEDCAYKWGCSSRADTIDKDLVDEMSSAGMRAMFLGVETGSPRMQKLTHKNLNLDKAFEIISHLIEKGVYVTASFIYGFPDETEEDIEQTLMYSYRLSEIGLSSVQYHLCAIFPGTEYYDIHKDSLLLAKNVSDHVGDFGVKENLEFIKENKALFPFYYEYYSDLRDKFNGLSRSITVTSNVYRKLSVYDPDRFANKRMVDLHLEIKAANEGVFDTSEKDVCKEHEAEIIANYLSAYYSAEECAKLKEIFAFYQDLQIAGKAAEGYSDVKMYNIDMNAVVAEKKLSQISTVPTMVYFTKTGKNVSYVIKPLMKM